MGSGWRVTGVWDGRQHDGLVGRSDCGSRRTHFLVRGSTCIVVMRVQAWGCALIEHEFIFDFRWTVDGPQDIVSYI